MPVPLPSFCPLFVFVLFFYCFFLQIQASMYTEAYPVSLCLHKSSILYPLYCTYYFSCLVVEITLHASVSFFMVVHCMRMPQFVQLSLEDKHLDPLPSSILQIMLQCLCHSTNLYLGQIPEVEFLGQRVSAFLLITAHFPSTGFHFALPPTVCGMTISPQKQNFKN